MDPISAGLNMHYTLLRRRCEFSGEVGRALFPALPSLSASLLHFPFSLHSAGKTHILDCSQVLTPPKTEKPQCCAAVWMYIWYPITPSLVSPAQQSPYHTTEHEGVVPLHDPTGWHDTAPEAHSKRLSPISTITLLSWLCIQQQQVQLHQNKLD